MIIVILIITPSNYCKEKLISLAVINLICSY